MRAVVHGSTLPVLEITLSHGERVITETGELSWKTPSISMKTGFGAGASGFFGAMGRAVSGGGLFMTEYEATQGAGQVAFAAKIPGTVTEIAIAPGASYLIHQHGFLCGTPDVQLSAGFQRRLGAGIFGGNGFVMQKVSGQGQFWIELGGELIQKSLAPGEVIQVHPGHVGMLDSSVSFDIVAISGVKNLFFGGDGVFLAQLTGPGNVWLQTLTLPNLAHALSLYLNQK